MIKLRNLLMINFHYLFIVSVIVLGLITIVGSGAGDRLFGCEDCNDEAAAVRERLGPPDDYTLYDSGDGYWSLTYWYWCEGISYTFTQDGCDCDVSTYRFDPICD